MEDLHGCGCSPSTPLGTSRRQAIRSLVGGSLLLPGILGRLLADDAKGGPLAPQASHHPARAKRVIFLFMPGGVSHLESFDPKPALFALDGKTVKLGPHVKNAQNLLKPLFEFKPGGRCGTMVSDLFPHIREVMDDVCVIRSMRSDHNDHFQSTLGIHTGSVSFARPSIGSWISYGLGTFNQNLPSFVVIAPQLPYAGAQVFSNDFLPAYHQGTRVVPGPEPIANLRRRTASEEIQEMELGLMHAFNREHLGQREADTALAARIKAFETAFSMQREVPEAFDLAKESDDTLVRIADEAVVTADRQIEMREDQVRVRKALMQLTSEQREAILLSRYQGLSYAEIAEIAGCSEGAVKTRVFRAMESLKKILVLDGEGGEQWLNAVK